MKSTTLKTNPELFHTIIRVTKEDSAFLYFTLEANEGLCMYSTLGHQVGQSHRDIEIKSDLKFRTQILHLLKQLEKLFPLMVIKAGPA